MEKRIKKLIPLIILLTVLAVILTNLGRSSRRQDQPLRVSGTIEAVEVMIAFEIGGQIDLILVKEGDEVKAGNVIASLEDEMLHAQLNRAKASLEQALADQVLITAQPLSEQRKAAISEAQFEHLLAQQALQELVENADLARAEAGQALEDAEQDLEDLIESVIPQSLTLEAVAQAEKNLDKAKRNHSILTNPPPQSAVEQAVANVLLAGDVRDQTKEDIETANRKLKRGLGPYYPKELNEKYKKQLRVAIKNLEIKLSRDQLAYENAVEKYNQLISPVDPIELALAESSLAMAEAQLEQKQREYERVKGGASQADIAVLEARIEITRREYEAVKDGPDPNELAIARARVDNAAAILSLADSDTIREQLAVAQAQVDAATAAVNLIQIQLDKLVLTSPIDGIVLYRAIEPGEVVNPGDQAITIGLLDELRITVYLPEYYYDHAQELENVQISVDAYPGESFSGRIISIANESNFVRRNVGGQEGGSGSLFAVTISVDDVETLKPGMLAEIEFPN
jgi:HlyD family secretion protein